MSGAQILALLGAALGSLGVAVAADPPAATNQDSPPQEVVIVRGQAIERIRAQVRRAEDAVYARFNEINSSDRFDIHCYELAMLGTRMRQRMCMSNAWREYDAAVGEGILRGLQSGVPGGGGDGARAQAGSANQLETERRVAEEMARLAHSDPTLEAAMQRLGQAYQAQEIFTGSEPEWTLYREVDGSEQQLPGDARRLIEVRIGREAWNHTLTARMFTIAGVEGRIKNIRLDCDKAGKNLEYVDDVDWVIPDEWGDCSLQVNAKRGTTFALYELE